MDRTYSADLAACRLARDDLAAALADLPLACNRRNDLLLVASEVLTNVVRHGAPAASMLRVTLDAKGSSLTLGLADDGGYFDGFGAALADDTVELPEILDEGGMGLSLIAHLVTSASYDRVGNGNRLTITEPLAVPAKPRVVVIDDDLVVSALVRGYLAADYDVTCFHDPHSALAHLSGTTPDLIISDIGMPEIDGLELRRRLQADPTTALVPFIFLTGVRDEAVESIASELDIDDFLEKPISPARLRNTATRVLRRSRGLRESMQASVDRRVTDALKSPLPNRLGPWRLTVLDAPATPGGGDLVMHASGEGWSTVMMLDVMGHGVAAKIFAYAYAGYLQSLLGDPAIACRPERLVHALSERIMGDVRLGETIVTCVAATLRDGGTVTLASGGHPRPYLHRHGHGWRIVPISGDLPGLGTPAPATKTLTLDRGDALLLVTDGLGEALSKDTPEPALLEALSGIDPERGDALETLEALTRNDPTPEDDRTAILVTFAPPGAAP